MKRALKYLGITLALAGAAGFGLILGPSILIAWGRTGKHTAMHQGHVIVDYIRAHDQSINATWTLDDDGQPDVVIRNVFDREKQDAILGWAKAVKERGRVRGHIALDFQKEIPHSTAPDTILRSEHF